MRLVFLLLVVVALMVSCTGKRYGHYAYVKKKPVKVSHIQAYPTSHKQVSRILNCKPLAIEVTDKGIDTISYTGQTSLQNMVRTSINNKYLPVIRNEATPVAKKQHTVVAERPKRRLNDNVGESYLTLLKGILVCYIPFVGWVYGGLLIIRSVKLALKAIDEIDREPDKYYGMGLAMLSIFSSVMILASVIFGLMIITAFFLGEAAGYNLIWLS